MARASLGGEWRAVLGRIIGLRAVFAALACRWSLVRMKKLDEPTAAFVEKVRTGIASIKKLRGRIEPRTSERIVATCIELHSACDEMEGLVELAEEAQPEPEPAPEPAPEPKPESKQKGGKK